LHKRLYASVAMKLPFGSTNISKKIAQTAISLHLTNEIQYFGDVTREQRVGHLYVTWK